MDLDLELDAQPTFTRTLRGTIWLFLKANQFRVQLSGGQLVDAVLPDDLMDEILPYCQAEPIVRRIGVTIEFRDPPSMHRIVEIRGGDVLFIGEPRAARR
jgi:hypothetical protein